MRFKTADDVSNDNRLSYRFANIIHRLSWASTSAKSDSSRFSARSARSAAYHQEPRLHAFPATEPAIKGIKPKRFGADEDDEDNDNDGPNIMDMTNMTLDDVDSSVMRDAEARINEEAKQAMNSYMTQTSAQDNLLMGLAQPQVPQFNSKKRVQPSPTKVSKIRTKSKGANRILENLEANNETENDLKNEIKGEKKKFNKTKLVTICLILLVVLVIAIALLISSVDTSGAGDKRLEQTLVPTKNPTGPTTPLPTNNPTTSPSNSPTSNPSKSPSKFPTHKPTKSPSFFPTKSPTIISFEEADRICVRVFGDDATAFCVNEQFFVRCFRDTPEVINGNFLQVCDAGQRPCPCPFRKLVADSKPCTEDPNSDCTLVG